LKLKKKRGDNMKKSILVLVLIVFTKLFSQTGVPSANGNGTEESPYEIVSLENLLWISQNSEGWDKHFIQTVDIDASPTLQWNVGEGWLPITTFSGNYDGAGFSIHSLYINRPGADHQGLFGLLLAGSSVANLGLSTGNVTGRNWTGILAGESYGSVDNSFVDGNLTTNSGGGLIGLNRGQITDSHSSVSIAGSGGGLTQYNEGTVTNCYTTSDIIGNNIGPVGGLIAYNYGTISDCYSTGNVGNSWGGNSGGLVADNHASIINSYATGAVSGVASTGGLVGYNEGSSALIDNCYALGYVTDIQIHISNSSGGLVGYNISGTIRNSYSRGNINRNHEYAVTYIGGFMGRNRQGIVENCYSTGWISYLNAANPSDKGFAGGVDTGGNFEMSGNFWDIEMSGQTSTAGIADPKTTIEMQTQSTFTNWDFTDIWGIFAGFNDGYPYLQWQSGAPAPPNSLENVKISIAEATVTITWNEVPEATSYKIYSSDIPDGEFSEETEGAFDGLSWSKVIGDSKKFYHVIAVN
jgi:hypothetical protein